MSAAHGQSHGLAELKEDLRPSERPSRARSLWPADKTPTALAKPLEISRCGRATPPESARDFADSNFEGEVIIGLESEITIISRIRELSEEFRRQECKPNRNYPGCVTLITTWDPSAISRTGGRPEVLVWNFSLEENSI